MDYVTIAMSKIDDLGRVVIPKELRSQMGFVPGSSIAIESNGAQVRIRKVAMGDQVRNRLDELQGAIATLAKTRPNLARQLADHVDQMNAIVDLTNSENSD